MMTTRNVNNKLITSPVPPCHRRVLRQPHSGRGDPHGHLEMLSNIRNRRYRPIVPHEEQRVNRSTETTTFLRGMISHAMIASPPVTIVSSTHPRPNLIRCLRVMFLAWACIVPRRPQFGHCGRASGLGGVGAVVDGGAQFVAAVA